MASALAPTTKAFALIVGPILLGVGAFFTMAPPQTAGVYVEIADNFYPLSACDTEDARAFSTHAPATPDKVASFYVVHADTASTPLSDGMAQLFLTVVNHAQPEMDFERLAIDTDVHTMSPGVYRVASSHDLKWEFGGLSESVYRQALARHPGNRATTELLIELDVPDPSGRGTCRYGMVLGPPPNVRDTSLGWFVPPTGEVR